MLGCRTPGVGRLACLLYQECSSAHTRSLLVANSGFTNLYRYASNNVMPPMMKTSYYKGMDSSTILRLDKLKAYDLKIKTQFKMWIDTYKGSTDSVKEKSLEALMADILAENQQGSEYRSGNLCIEVVDSVLKTLDTDIAQQQMHKFVNVQPYGALGAILKYARTEKRLWMEAAVTNRMEEGIADITRGNDLVSAYTYFKHGWLPRENTVALEAKTLHLASTLPAKNIVKILHTMALMKYRSPIVMNTLVFQLQQRPAAITGLQLTNLFFSCSSLRIYSQRMLSCLEILSSPIVNDRDALTEDNAYNLLISIGKLRWNNPALVTLLARQIQNPGSLNTQRFSSLLLTCNIVGVLPENIKASILSQIKVASSGSDCQSYMDIVWSLLVFGIKSQAIFKDLLSEEKIKLLITPSETVRSFTANGNYNKLLNIAMEARMSFGMDMPALLAEDSTRNPLIGFSEYHNQLFEMLTECLNCDAANIERNVCYPTGHILDYRYLYDTQEGKVVPPSKYLSPYDIETGDKTKPPGHMTWVTLLAHSFHNMTIGVSNANIPEGRRRLAALQLSKMGYHVIQIKDGQFKSDPDRTRKMEWLREKISLAEPTEE